MSSPDPDIEPQFEFAAADMLRRFQDSLRARIFELVRNNCIESDDPVVTESTVERCTLAVMRHLVNKGRIF